MIEYPEYGFANNSGYGTKEHLDAIELYGITPIHRKTFHLLKNTQLSEGEHDEHFNVNCLQG